jgi:DNA-binding CsgD family transcriptional regulator
MALATPSPLLDAAPETDSGPPGQHRHDWFLGIAPGQDRTTVLREIERSLSGDAGDATLPIAFTSLALATWHAGRVVEALSLVRAALRRADRQGRRTSSVVPQLVLTSILISVEELEVAAQAARSLHTADDPLLAAASAVVHARLRLAQGDPAAALQAVDPAMTMRTSGWEVVGHQAQAIAAIVALRRDDLDGAIRHVRGDRAWSSAAGLFGPYLPALVTAQVIEAQHGARAGLDVVAELLDDTAGRRRLLVEDPASAGWLVRTATTAGDVRRARLAASDAAELAMANPELGALGAAADHARGLLEQDPDLLARAAAGHAQPLARGTAAEDAGVLLTAHHHDRQARAHFTVALACYEASSSDVDAARVRRRMQHRDRSRGRTPRPTYGWMSLTDTERRVALAVADGLTNPQVGRRMFLSRHTVDFHLRQIFRKLAVHSRFELTREVLLHVPS